MKEKQQTEIEEIREVIDKLDDKAKNILMLVAKGMIVASENKKGE